MMVVFWTVLFSLGLSWGAAVQAPSTSSAEAHIIFFEESSKEGAWSQSPLRNFTVTVNGGEYRTNLEGELRLLLPQGTHRLGFSGLTEALIFEIHPPTPTQVLVRRLNLGKGIEPQFEVEAGPSVTSETASTSFYQFLIRDFRGQPLPQARVFIEGKADPQISDANGLVKLGARPGLGYVIQKQGFETQQGNFGPESSQEMVMQPAREDLGEFRVLAPRVKGGVSALLEVRRQSRGVSEVLGAEQMARSGDSDAAGSLRRVTGLTLVGGRYVYIRGLGERYSSILLNGASLSSPEPARRVVPLDLFPVSVLDSLVIEKSFSPDLPAEFAGGAIRFSTKAIPDKFFARVSVGGSYEGADENFLSYQGGARDWTGRDDGTRALPAAVAAATAGGQKLKERNPLFPEGYSAEELSQLGQSFSNVWSAQRRPVSGGPGFSVGLGNRISLGSGWALGGQLGFLYGRDFESLEKTSARLSLGNQGALVKDSSRKALDSEEEIRWASSGDAGLEWRKGGITQKVSYSQLDLRNTTNSVSVTEELNANGQFRTTQLDWVEREIRLQQVRGEHTWSEGPQSLKISWLGSRSLATREAPDGRQTRYLLENGDYVFSTRADGNQRTFSSLRDLAEEMTLQAQWRRELPSSGHLELSFGGTGTQRSRQNGLRRFHWRDVRASNSGIDLRAPAEEVLAPGNMNPNGFQILETTRETDTAQAFQNIEAWFGNIDWKTPSPLRLTLGMRREVSIQDVTTFNLFDPSNRPVRGGLETIDVLPAHGVVWEISSGSQVRGSYSETVSRPDFKELSVAPYIDEETGQEIRGNENLLNAIVTNYDLRYEFYPSPEESFSVAVFRKTFERPIEQVLRIQGDDILRTFDNAESALNDGLELEARVRLRRWSEAARRWTLGTNVALIQSRINLGEQNSGVQTSNQRPLQGQSPWVLNLQLFYDHRTRGLSSGVLFNVVGPRIREASASGLPDVYEQPQQQLDVVSSWKFRETSVYQASLQLRLRNLLDPEVVLTQGDEKVLAYRRGRSASLQISAVF